MNELQLSNDLTTIETEIKSYQNIAGQSIFEIGRRLKHVKENDLAHGEFGKWLKKINMTNMQANRFMKVSEEFPNLTPGLNLGITVLYQLATLPSEIREQPQELENGEVKKPIDMTRREIEQLKRQIKESKDKNAQLQSQVEQAQRSEEIAKKQLEDAESREPEVKREIKEVVPPHVKAQLSDRQRMIDAKDKEIKELQKQISKAQEQKENFEKQDHLEEEEQIASMNFQVESTVLEIKDNINRFLTENASSAFKNAAIARASDRTRNQIYDGIEELEEFCKAMRRSLQSSTIIEEGY